MPKMLGSKAGKLRNAVLVGRTKQKTRVSDWPVPKVIPQAHSSKSIFTLTRRESILSPHHDLDSRKHNSKQGNVKTINNVRIRKNLVALVED